MRLKTVSPQLKPAKPLSAGLEQSALSCTLQCFPIGDGGDGTAGLIVKNANGFFEELTATDPLFRKIKTSIGFIDLHQTAVIEMAEISGLKLLQEQEKNPTAHYFIWHRRTDQDSTGQRGPENYSLYRRQRYGRRRLWYTTGTGNPLSGQNRKGTD